MGWQKKPLTLQDVMKAQILPGSILDEQGWADAIGGLLFVGSHTHERAVKTSWAKIRYFAQSAARPDDFHFQKAIIASVFWHSALRK